MSDSNIYNTLSHDDIYNFWKDNNIFEKSIEQNTKNPSFVFYDGPPFATGLPHYGHILAGLIKDTILRFQHNQGHNVPRNAGWDCHGLPIEYEIEKDLGIKTTDEILSYGIGNYNEKCRSIVMKYSGEWEQIMGRLARWVDFKNDYKTMTPEFMNGIWWVFKQLYDKGRVYEGVRIMPYSTTCGTPLSNFETQQNYQEVMDDSLFIALPLVNQFANKDANIMVWTTTPWTLPSNYALCVNAHIEYSLVEFKNKYYIVGKNLILIIFKDLTLIKVIKTFFGNELIGLEYTPPFEYNVAMLNNKYKIISDDFVTDTDGTGIVHIAPAYGEDDHRVCMQNGIINKESKLFQPLDTNGFVSSDIPEFIGMFYKNFVDKTNQDLNTTVIIQLKEKGYYYDKRQIIHNYPFCWRSDTPLIYRSVSSWFVSVEDIRTRMVELNNKINWIPGSVGSSRFANWLVNARDWGISRSRFWGTPIPIWKSLDGDVICVGSSYELEELANLEPGSIKDLHRHHIDHIVIHKNSKEYYRIPEVFDCWFESGSMPYSSINRIGIVELLRKSEKGIQISIDSKPFIETTDGKIHYILPADFIAEGIDQTRGWFYTLLVLSTSLFDMIPFKNVIVNGLVLAEDGKKMSKRLKNYPDPMEIIKEYGSDCLRLYLLSSPAVKADSLKFSKNGVHTMMKEIIIPYKNTIVFFKEYYNLYKKEIGSNPIFDLEIYTKSNGITLSLRNPLNIWIINEYSKLRDEYYRYMKEYNLKSAIFVLIKLVQVLNNGFIKLGRNQLKGKDTQELWAESLSTLYYIIKYFINDFKSIIPFFCEQQYLELSDIFKKDNIDDLFWQYQSIHLNNLISELSYMIIPEDKLNLAIDFDIVYNIIFTILQIRSQYNISVKKPLRSISIIIDSKFESFYSTRYREYLSFVLEECNVMDIKILDYSELSVSKTITPIKSQFFKKYKKNILDIFKEIELLTSEQLDEIINVGSYKDTIVDISLFNIKQSICFNNQLLDNGDFVFKDFIFANQPNQPNQPNQSNQSNQYKITIVVDKYYDEEIDKLYYYRLVATKIQRCRKYANLHPWDNVNSYYNGNSKYCLDNDIALKYIQDITKVKLLKYTNENIFYEKQFDDLDIKLYLEKL